MPTYRTQTAEETRALGKVLGAGLVPGDVVLLSGPMGAGKSELARGIARGIGIEGPMPSPSFPILLVYEGPDFPLYHMDLYRLEGEEECEEIGLSEYLGGDGVAVVEWPDRAPGLMPARRLEIHMGFSDTPEERELNLVYRGGMGEIPLEQWEGRA